MNTTGDYGKWKNARYDALLHLLAVTEYLIESVETRVNTPRQALAKIRQETEKCNAALKLPFGREAGA